MRRGWRSVFHFDVAVWADMSSEEDLTGGIADRCWRLSLCSSCPPEHLPAPGAQLKNLLSDIHQHWINSAHRSVLNAIFPPSIPLISLYNYRLNVFSCLTFWRGWKVAVKTDAMGEISQGQPAAKWRRDKKQKDTWHLNAWLLCLQQTYYSVHSCLNKVKHFKTIKCEQIVLVFRNLWAMMEESENCWKLSTEVSNVICIWIYWKST